MQGNIGRCGTYQRIRQAIRQAGGGARMREVRLVSRRGFLGSMFSAGALILAARVLPMNGRNALAAGEAGVQLTWMDVKVGDWVVTPWHGKPVEIQALWYNALRVMERLAHRFRLGVVDRAIH